MKNVGLVILVRGTYFRENFEFLSGNKYKNFYCNFGCNRKDWK